MNVDVCVINTISNMTQISADRINLTDVLFDDLGMDSLDVPELVLDLEEQYKIVIPDNKVNGFETVLDIVEYINTVVQ